jgi:hypothetical protein
MRVWRCAAALARSGALLSAVTCQNAYVTWVAVLTAGPRARNAGFFYFGAGAGLAARGGAKARYSGSVASCNLDPVRHPGVY